MRASTDALNAWATTYAERGGPVLPHYPMCSEPVCPPPYFSDYPCRNKAKWLADGRGKTDRPLCGQHVRWYRNHGTNVRPHPIP